MGDLVRWMLSKAHDTHLSQHSALTQRDIWWWNQENTTHTHTHDSAPSNEGPVNTICWWGRASQTVTYSSMESTVLCLHFHQGNPSWDDYKETYREQQAKCSHWKPQEHAIPSWHKLPGHTLASLQGFGALLTLGSSPRNGQHQDTSYRQQTAPSLKPAKGVSVLLKPTQEAGIFHLWFPNCPDW